MKLNDCFAKGFLRKEPPSLAKAKKSLSQAAGFIKKAEDNFKIQNYDLTIIASYAAMFHCVRALLFKEGIKERSHLCAIEYVKEAFPRIREDALTVDSFRRFRHTALYGLDVAILAKDAAEAIAFAKEFLLKVKNLIK